MAQSPAPDPGCWALWSPRPPPLRRPPRSGPRRGCWRRSRPRWFWTELEKKTQNLKGSREEEEKKLNTLLEELKEPRPSVLSRSSQKNELRAPVRRQSMIYEGMAERKEKKRDEEKKETKKEVSEKDDDLSFSLFLRPFSSLSLFPSFFSFVIRSMRPNRDFFSTPPTTTTNLG